MRSELTIPKPTPVLGFICFSAIFDKVVECYLIKRYRDLDAMELLGIAGQLPFQIVSFILCAAEIIFQTCYHL